MWYVCDVYAVLYVCISYFVVHGCAVSRRYKCYLDHLKFCVVCVYGQRSVCCSECNVVSNECNEPTSCFVQPIGMHGGEVMNFGCVCFRGELGFLNWDDMLLLTIVCGSPIIPLLVHLQAYPSIRPAAASLQRGLSTNPGVTMWCICGCS